MEKWTPHQVATVKEITKLAQEAGLSVTPIQMFNDGIYCPGKDIDHKNVIEEADAILVEPFEWCNKDKND